MKPIGPVLQGQLKGEEDGGEYAELFHEYAWRLGQWHDVGAALDVQGQVWNSADEGQAQSGEF